MNNLLISDQMVASLYDEPTIAELYRTEQSIPSMIVFFQRAMKMSKVSNLSTLALLGRVLKVGGLALGYLQLLRPPKTVQAQTVLAALKTSCIAAANFLLTYSINPQVTGSIQVSINEQALQALERLEKYDPAQAHLKSITTTQGTRVYVEGNGVDLADIVADIVQGYHLVGGAEITLSSGIVMNEDLLSDLNLVLSGIIFPIEAL